MNHEAVGNHHLQTIESVFWMVEWNQPWCLQIIPLASPFVPKHNNGSIQGCKPTTPTSSHGLDTKHSEATLPSVSYKFLVNRSAPSLSELKDATKLKKTFKNALNATDPVGHAPTLERIPLDMFKTDPMEREALDKTEFYLDHGLIFHFNGFWTWSVDLHKWISQFQKYLLQEEAFTYPVPRVPSSWSLIQWHTRISFFTQIHGFGVNLAFA